MIVEVCSAVTVPPVAVKAVELEPAGTVTDAGTPRLVLLELRLTAAPPEGASPVRIRVQVLEPVGARLDGVHASEFGTTEGAVAVKLMVDCREAPLRETVTVAELLAFTVEAVALNVAEADPAATATELGTVKLLLLLLVPSVRPPVAVAPLKVTVHFDVPAVLRDEGLHVNELSVGVEPTVMVPPVVLESIDPPADEAAKTLVTLVLKVPVEIEGVIDTVATTPSAIWDVLRPDARQT